MFAPAYVGRQRRAEGPSKVCLFSLPATNGSGDAEYAPMFIVRKMPIVLQSRPPLVRFRGVFLFRVLNFQ